MKVSYLKTNRWWCLILMVVSYRILILGEIWTSLGLMEFCDQLTISCFEGKLGVFSDYGFTTEHCSRIAKFSQQVTGITEHRVCGVLLPRQYIPRKGLTSGHVYSCAIIIFTGLCVSHPCCIDDLSQITTSICNSSGVRLHAYLYENKNMRSCQ